jgi:hypothetical protein
MNKTARGYSITLITLVSALAMASCIRMGESAIKLPANPVLTAGLGWGVVKDAYVRLKESPSDSARDVDHLRRGGVFSLSARVFGPEGKSSSGSASEAAPAIWYSVSSEGFNGWVRSTELDIYSSQEQAKKAASAYP